MSRYINSLFFILFSFKFIVGQTSILFSPNNIEVTITSNGKMFDHAPFGKGFSREDYNGTALLQSGILLNGMDIGWNTKSLITELKDWHETPSPLPGISNENGNFIEIDTFYKVTKGEILSHITDYNDNGIIEDTIKSIFNWPGYGNMFSGKIGETIDIDNYEEIVLAPYFDSNNSEMYQPEAGDFPFQRQNGRYPEEEAIPDEMIYFITSSVHNNLKMNIGYLLYGFSCPGNAMIDNTIFLEITFQNIMSTDLFCQGTSLMFDSSFGFGGDDALATDTIHEAIIIFDNEIDTDPPSYSLNRDNLAFVSKKIFGGRSNESPAYRSQGNCIPTSNTSALINAKVDHTAYYYLNNVSNPNMNLPTNFDFYNINGQRWIDGSAFTYGGNGYNFNSIDTAKYIFDGNLYTKEGWVSDHATFNKNQNKIITQTIGKHVLSPTAFDSYTYTLSIWDHSEENSIYEQLDSFENHLNEYYYIGWLHSEGNMCGNILSSASPTKKINPRIYPNPAYDYVHIDNVPSDSKVKIYDLIGNLIHQIESKKSHHSITVADWAKGLYIAVVIDRHSGAVESKKFVVR